MAEKDRPTDTREPRRDHPAHQPADRPEGDRDRPGAHPEPPIAEPEPEEPAPEPKD